MNISEIHDNCRSNSIVYVIRIDVLNLTMHMIFLMTHTNCIVQVMHFKRLNEILTNLLHNLRNYQSTIALSASLQ